MFGFEQFLLHSLNLFLLPRFCFNTPTLGLFAVKEPFQENVPQKQKYHRAFKWKRVGLS